MNNKKEGGYYSQMVHRYKDELVGILPHKWVEPVTIPLVYKGIDPENS